jgi:hypothetical protein
MSFRVLSRACAGLLVTALILLGSVATANAGQLQPGKFGELDCNGQSTMQTSVNSRLNCSDIRGFDTWTPNTWDGRFYDNGEYIGHDEPDMTFLSNARGSGDDVTWTETIPRDPSRAPTVKHPGSDVSHWFELTPAPWFSMAMCDPNSYPNTDPGSPSACKPESDSNAPTCIGGNTTNCSEGGGSAFMEMQLYPPGMPPWVDSTSCDDSHWCAALTIDSLECTTGFATCNSGCEEPINFAWIQRDGVPTGPASPQESDLASSTPNRQTLLLNPGDQIRIHMFDAPAPGGGKAFEVVIHDLTTGQTGYMQASAANGFATTSMSDCSGTPYNFQPEYSTAGAAETIPWAALQTNISTEFETGHWEPCTSVTDPGTYTIGSFTDVFYNTCNGPYEDAGPPDSTTPEVSDAFCYPAGDTHGALNSAPDEMSGCEDNYYQNGDLDFDGTPYYPEWPTGPNPTSKFPGSFVQSLPTTGGAQYSKFFMQTDIALSESTCTATGAGCSVPPAGPGGFYPYWTRVTTTSRGQASCTLEFGNVSRGAGVNDFGGDAEYGVDLQSSLGYPEYEGPVFTNACRSGNT